MSCKISSTPHRWRIILFSHHYLLIFVFHIIYTLTEFVKEASFSLGLWYFDWKTNEMNVQLYCFVWELLVRIKSYFTYSITDFRCLLISYCTNESMTVMHLVLRCADFKDSLSGFTVSQKNQRYNLFYMTWYKVCGSASILTGNITVAGTKSEQGKKRTTLTGVILLLK